MPDKSKPRVLVVVNPNASRAEAALPGLSSWFTENCDARIVVTKSKKERMRALEAHGKEVDLIVIGGGDGRISTAVSQLMNFKRPFAVIPLGTANDFARTLACRPIRSRQPRSHSMAANAASTSGWSTTGPISMSRAWG
jgi:diacylglycerol kinase (ATP)